MISPPLLVEQENHKSQKIILVSYGLLAVLGLLPPTWSVGERISTGYALV